MFLMTNRLNTYLSEYERQKPPFWFDKTQIGT